MFAKVKWFLPLPRLPTRSYPVLSVLLTTSSYLLSLSRGVDGERRGRRGERGGVKVLVWGHGGRLEKLTLVVEEGCPSVDGRKEGA